MVQQTILCRPSRSKLAAPLMINLVFDEAFALTATTSLPFDTWAVACKCDEVMRDPQRPAGCTCGTGTGPAGQSHAALPGRSVAGRSLCRSQPAAPQVNTPS